MTGRELIIYILEHHLEDEDIFQDGQFIGFKTTAEVAEETGVGKETVHVWCALNMIPHVTIGGVFFIPGNYKSPVETK